MELTIAQLLQRGIDRHQEGKLKEAELTYRVILKHQPNHPVANHNLGVIAVSMNNSGLALPFFKVAIETNPKIEQFWVSYIDALIKNKKFVLAKQVLADGENIVLAGEHIDFLKAKLNNVIEVEKQYVQKNDSIKPSQEQINKLLKCYQNGRYIDAEQLALSITEQFPENQFSWKVLGGILKQTGRTSEALHVNKRTLQLDPNDPEAHNNLGVTFQDLGILEDAESSYKQAIILKCDFSQAHYNLGIIQKKLGKLEEAEVSYKQAIAHQSGFAAAHTNLGNTLQELGRLEEAEASHRQAIAMKVDYAEAYNNLGSTLQELGRLEESEANFRQAIVLRSNFAEAYNNLGVTLQDLGRLEEAEVSYRKAIELKTNFAEAMLNLSIVQDYMNNLEETTQSLNNVLKIDSDYYGLKAYINLAILKFLEDDFVESKKLLLASFKIQEKLSLEFKNAKVYHSYLFKILNWHNDKSLDYSNLKFNKKLYVIGESHTLTSHRTLIQSLGKSYLGKSFLIQGCNQWSLGNFSKNKYKNKFENVIHSIPKASKILLAIGEIDCRLDSGIIKHINKFPKKNIKELITTTIVNYLNYVLKFNFCYNHTIIIQGVPCPNIKTKNISQDAVKQLIEVIKVFNIELKNKSKKMGFGFLDIHKLTDRGDGFSNNIWHMDTYHLSAEGMQEAWNNYFFH